MSFFLIALCIVLFVIVVVQVGRVSELISRIKGDTAAQLETNNRNGLAMLVIGAIFLVLCVVTSQYYSGTYIGFGVLTAVSEHGISVDFMFKITLVITGIVFFVTQIALFYYSWRYRARQNTKATYWAHDNRLEMVWMAIPAVAMTLLVILGMNTWNKAMADIPKGAIAGKDFIEVEATGYQFAWILRYPGADNQLGEKNFKLITGDNPLGMDWRDTRNHDDVISQGGDTIKLPVNMPVRVRITSRDVLHNFYLPHFHVKMDAVPGMPTYFVFTPTVTTDSIRTRLSGSKDWNVEITGDDGAKIKKWQTFTYELACAELCGKGHFSMRRVVEIVTQDEFVAWAAKQKPFYSGAVPVESNTSTSSRIGRDSTTL